MSGRDRSKKSSPSKRVRKTQKKVFCRDCGCGQIHFDGKRIDVHFAKKNISEENALEWASKLREQICKLVEQAPELKFLPAHVCLQENLLVNDGVRHFCEALLHDRLQIDSLKLYKNQITDEGAKHVAQLISNVIYPVTEIHLSHNLITIASARSIFSSLRRQNQAMKYPCLPLNAPPSCTKPVPLWLRLEHNFIDLLQARAYLNELSIRDCAAESHKHRKTAVCGPRKCGIDWDTCLQDGETPVHLFSFPVQYTPDSIQPIPVTSSCDQDLFLPGAGPLFIFLDTNAVLSMVSKEGGFSFQTLLSKASKGQFGWKLSEAKKATCILPFTVLRELDALKSENRLRGSISKLHKDIFPLGEESGALQLLSDRFEGRMKADSGSLSNNDDIILKQIKQYQKELGISARTCLVTGDRSMITISKKMNIAVVQIEQLDDSLEDKESMWSSDLLWECVQKHSPTDISSLETHISTVKCLQESMSVIDEWIKAVGDDSKYADLISRSKRLALACQSLREESS